MPACAAGRKTRRSSALDSTGESRRKASPWCKRQRDISRVADEPAGQTYRLAAWLAAQQGDVLSERRELEKLVAIAPADAAALDRLAQIAEIDGRSTEAARLRGEKSEMEGRRARYLTLYERTQHVRDAEEMARLADELGRPFESRVFLTIAVSDEPEREDLKRELSRLSKSPALSNDRRQTLEEAIALELHENQ